MESLPEEGDGFFVIGVGILAFLFKGVEIHPPLIASRFLLSTFKHL